MSGEIHSKFNGYEGFIIEISCFGPPASGRGIAFFAFIRRVHDADAWLGKIVFVREFVGDFS